MMLFIMVAVVVAVAAVVDIQVQHAQLCLRALHTGISPTWAIPGRRSAETEGCSTLHGTTNRPNRGRCAESWQQVSADI